MAVNPNPPIQIDPDMDKGHQWSFVNQNFRSISDALDKQSFTIVKTNTTTISANAGTTGTITVAHNLGYTPLALVYIDNGSGNLQPLPTTNGTNLDTVNHIVTFTDFLLFSVDTANLYLFWANPAAANLGPLNLKYFLLQQSAT